MRPAVFGNEKRLTYAFALLSSSIDVPKRDVVHDIVNYVCVCVVFIEIAC